MMFVINIVSKPALNEKYTYTLRSNVISKSIAVANAFRDFIISYDDHIRGLNFAFLCLKFRNLQNQYVQFIRCKMKTNFYI